LKYQDTCTHRCIVSTPVHTHITPWDGQKCCINFQIWSYPFYCIYTKFSLQVQCFFGYNFSLHTTLCKRNNDIAEKILWNNPVVRHSWTVWPVLNHQISFTCKNLINMKSRWEGRSDLLNIYHIECCINFQIWSYPFYCIYTKFSLQVQCFFGYNFSLHTTLCKQYSKTL
jgi:hypothetical protein